jgi:hypothetical protein
MATITRHDKTVAYVLGEELLTCLLETVEIVADPKAMKAIRGCLGGILSAARRTVSGDFSVSRGQGDRVRLCRPEEGGL